MQILTDTSIEREAEMGTAQSVVSWLPKTLKTFEDICVCKSLTRIMSLDSKAGNGKTWYGNGKNGQRAVWMWS